MTCHPYCIFGITVDGGDATVIMTGMVLSSWSIQVLKQMLYTHYNEMGSSGGNPTACELTKEVAL